MIRIKQEILLPRQGRFLDAQVLRPQESQIGEDLVPGNQEDDVPGDEFLGRDDLTLPSTQDGRLPGKNIADGVARLLGLPLLDEADYRVDDRHAEDDQGIEPVPPAGE